VAAVAVRFISAVFALAQEVVLALAADKCHGCEFATLVGAIAERLFAALAAGAEKILAVFFERDPGGLVGCDSRLSHLGFSCISSDCDGRNTRHG
jgi:hypothetical protein